jgi:hypothetical protein
LRPERKIAPSVPKIAPRAENCSRRRGIVGGQGNGRSGRSRSRWRGQAWHSLGDHLWTAGSVGGAHGERRKAPPKEAVRRPLSDYRDHRRARLPNQATNGAPMERAGLTLSLGPLAAGYSALLGRRGGLRQRPLEWAVRCQSQPKAAGDRGHGRVRGPLGPQTNAQARGIPLRRKGWLGTPGATRDNGQQEPLQERCRDWSPAGGGQRPGAAPLGPEAQPHSRRSHQDHRSRGAEPDLATCRVTEPLRQLCGRTSPLAFGDRGGPRARAPDMAIHMRGPGASDSLRRLGARAWHSLGDLAPRALGLSAIFLRPIGDFRHIFGD